MIKEALMSGNVSKISLSVLWSEMYFATVYNLMFPYILINIYHTTIVVIAEATVNTLKPTKYVHLVLIVL